MTFTSNNSVGSAHVNAYTHRSGTFRFGHHHNGRHPWGSTLHLFNHPQLKVSLELCFDLFAKEEGNASMGLSCWSNCVVHMKFHLKILELTKDSEYVLKLIK